MVIQAESYTLQYAALLAGSGAWSAAAQYLAWCPMSGEAAMCVLLSRVPLLSGGVPDERVASRVLRFCRLYGLPGTGWQTCAASVQLCQNLLA